MTDQNARVLDQFGKQAAAYARLLSRSGDSALLPLLEAARPTPADRVLDVGCGAGHLTLALAQVSGHVTGVDLTAAMLDQARRLQAEAGLANVEWRQGDVTELAFEGAAFDLVTSRAMLHHVADPARVIAEMQRVCAPGGRLAVMDLTPAPAKAAAFDAIEVLRDPSHVAALTADELRAIGRELGLTEAAVRSFAVELALEAVLATSFPGPGVLDQVRALYRRDAAAGADALGMSARAVDGAVHVTYPMTLVVWRV